MKDRFKGIMARLDWNTNKWQGEPEAHDIANSNFGYVKENSKTNTSFNFAIDPSAVRTHHFGFLPCFHERDMQLKKAKEVEIVFFISLDSENSKTFLVGFYAFPSFFVTSPNPTIPSLISNIKAFPQNIHLLSNYLDINTDLDQKRYLPLGKSISTQGWVYLNKQNVFYILDRMQVVNPEDKKLKSLRYRILTSM